MAGAAEIWAAWACMPVQVLAAHWQQPQAGPWAGPCTAPHRSAAQRSILLPQRSSAQLSAAQRSSAQLSAAYRSPEQTRHMLAGHLVGVCLLLAYRWSNGVHAQVHTFSAPCTVQDQRTVKSAEEQGPCTPGMHALTLAEPLPHTATCAPGSSRTNMLSPPL